MDINIDCMRKVLEFWIENNDYEKTITLYKNAWSDEAEKCSVTTGNIDPMKRNLHVANLNINHVGISGNLENRRGGIEYPPLYNK